MQPFVRIGKRSVEKQRRHVERYEQNPKPQTPKPKSQLLGIRLGFGIWDLGFGIYSYFQATRSGLPIRYVWFAPARGLNFWMPPLSTSDT